MRLQSFTITTKKRQRSSNMDSHLVCLVYVLLFSQFYSYSTSHHSLQKAKKQAWKSATYTIGEASPNSDSESKSLQILASCQMKYLPWGFAKLWNLKKCTGRFSGNKPSFQFWKYHLCILKAKQGFSFSGWNGLSFWNLISLHKIKFFKKVKFKCMYGCNTSRVFKEPIQYFPVAFLKISCFHFSLA